jgi:hypothetical protein
MIIHDKYQPRLLDCEAKEGYLNWSLNFFTDLGTIQSPYVGASHFGKSIESTGVERASEVVGSQSKHPVYIDRIPLCSGQL